MNLEIIIRVPIGVDASITREATGMEADDAFAPPPPAIPEPIVDRLGRTTGEGDDRTQRGHGKGNGSGHAGSDDETFAPPSLDELGLEGESTTEPPPPKIVERVAQPALGDAEPPGLEHVDLDSLGSALDVGAGPPSMADLKAMGAVEPGPATGKQPQSRGGRRSKAKEEEKAGA